MGLRLLFLLLGGMALAAESSYQSEIAEWRRAREARLKADGGWLSVAGLSWLHEGANRVGTAATNDVVLPDGPEQAGTFELHGGKVTAALGGIQRAIQLVGRLRQEKDAALADAASAKAEVERLNGDVERLTGEVNTLQAERKEVRSRIEKLLGQIDQLGAG